MPFLTAAVVFVATLCLVNLLLTYGVILRLRQHSQLLSSQPPADVGAVAVGSTIGEFVATASDGTVFSPSAFTGPTLIGFFAPGCSPCEDLIPGFLTMAAGGRDGTNGTPLHRILAVVTEGEHDGDYVSRLSGVVPVISGAQARHMATAFTVGGFPTVCVVDIGGVVTASGAHLISDLRLTAA